MHQWWFLRAVEEVGSLAPREWEKIASLGHRWHFSPGQRVVWFPAPGVLVVGHGGIRLTYQGISGPCRFDLEGGDVAGTLHAAPAVLEVLTTSTLHTFKHEEWLSALQQAPDIIQQLLRSLAWHVMQDDELY
ncbi:MAG: hypothetical protein M3220_12885 [Chloroflexota bacterium]|nr:hypothetical protein [Chloroflexota bacterium]